MFAGALGGSRTCLTQAPKHCAGTLGATWALQSPCSLCARSPVLCAQAPVLCAQGLVLCPALCSVRPELCSVRPEPCSASPEPC